MKWQNTFWLLFLISLVLFLAPLPVTKSGASGFDKVAHAMIFCALLTSSFRAYSHFKILFFLALVAYAVVVEAAQGTPTIGRDFEWYDILADLVGIGMGVAGFILTRGRSGSRQQ